MRGCVNVNEDVPPVTVSADGTLSEPTYAAFARLEPQRAPFVHIG